MKLVIRVFALAVVVAGAAAAAKSPSSAVVASHQSATAGLPVPMCGPGVPTCPPPGSDVR